MTVIDDPTSRGAELADRIDVSPIPVAGPWITQREISAVAYATGHSWFEHASDERRGFEAEFAAATGRAHAIALPSSTSAVHLSLLALGVGPGDEVIVPETTEIGTAAPISYLGATPVFADVEPDSWCISTDDARALLTERTKAIIAVDLYGGFPDLVGLEALAEEAGVAVIEDSGQAAGGRHAGRPAGSFGVTSAFNLDGSNTLTTGEGGMLVCDDDRLWERMLFLRDHGRLAGDLSRRSTEVGYDYRMSELQAAMGRVQLDRIEELVARKREIFDWYDERLVGAPLALNDERLGDRNTYSMVTAVLDPTARATADGLAARLRKRNIASRPFLSPLSSLGAFADTPNSARARRRNRVSYELAPRGINLPSALTLSERQVDRVCQTMHHAFAA